ncbi:MAG TPA: hypothetical protein VFQ80_18040 [Thermomicrobiales bacterium]|nr:hypothetical protein [Thermomicrobiales bacterium]
MLRPIGRRPIAVVGQPGVVLRTTGRSKQRPYQKAAPIVAAPGRNIAIVRMAGMAPPVYAPYVQMPPFVRQVIDVP